MGNGPGPPRGILRSPTSDAALRSGGEHVRIGPSARLAAHVAHFWWVAWDVAEPRVVETLPHPTAHIVFEAPSGSRNLTGASRQRFVRTLAGKGRVLGIKLRPAVLGILVEGGAARFCDRSVPIAEAIASLDLSRALLRAADAADAIDARATAQGAVEAAEQALGGAPWPALPTALVETRDLIERIEHDREIVRVEQAARAAGVDARTLERRFRAYVGLSPKAVIARYRLIEASVRLQSAEAPPLAALAAELGYADQAHFSRDFRALVGRSPRDLAQRASKDRRAR